MITIEYAPTIVPIHFNHLSNIVKYKREQMNKAVVPVIHTVNFKIVFH